MAPAEVLIAIVPAAMGVVVPTVVGPPSRAGGGGTVGFLAGTNCRGLCFT